MRYLAARVHASVSTSGYGQKWRLRGPERELEGILDRRLDRPQARLHGPAMELCAVIGQVEPQPDLGGPAGSAAGLSGLSGLSGLG